MNAMLVGVWPHSFIRRTAPTLEKQGHALRLPSIFLGVLGGLVLRALHQATDWICLATCWWIVR